MHQKESLIPLPLPAAASNGTRLIVEVEDDDGTDDERKRYLSGALTRSPRPFFNWPNPIMSCEKKLFLLLSLAWTWIWELKRSLFPV